MSRSFRLSSRAYPDEGMLLSENLRPSLQFNAAGREQINGRDVIVLQYQQVAYSPPAVACRPLL